MRKFICFLILTLGVFITVATARAAFVKVDRYGVVYDDLHNQYWVQSGPSSNGVFENTLAIIDILNLNDALEREFGSKVLWGTWHLASVEDMENL